MRARIARAVFLALLLIPSAAAARTWHVLPDGSGDAPTIQAAIDSSTDGDLVELADGTYRGEGNRDIVLAGKAITVRSASGDPGLCVLDCEGAESEPHRGFSFGAVSKGEAALEGITITNGWIAAEPYGGAVLCEGGSAPRIRSCVFAGNRGTGVACVDRSSPSLDGCVFSENAGWRGGGLCGREASPDVRGCSFSGNTSEWGGGAFYGHVGRPVFTDCEFVENESETGGAFLLLPGTMCECVDCLFLDNTGGDGGGIWALMCSTSVEGCVFAGNSAFGSAGAITTGKMSFTRIAGCTFWRNGGSDGQLLCGELETTIENTIIAYGTRGPAIAVAGIVSLSCSDLFGNPGGDWVGGLEDQCGVEGNLSADPLLCDPEGGDFTLRSDSPCLPGNHPDGADCGLIGALGEGCTGPTAARQTSWGAVKTLFR
ncbi:MAG: right-handed parallel beta-helix repeat-containing protein [Candidatus Eisenbacteria bacterium]